MRLAWGKNPYNVPEFTTHWARIAGGSSESARVTNSLWGDDEFGRFRELWEILGSQIRESVK